MDRRTETDWDGQKMDRLFDRQTGRLRQTKADGQTMTDRWADGQTERDRQVECEADRWETERDKLTDVKGQVFNFFVLCCDIL